MSEASNQPENPFCCSSHSIIPNSKNDFHKMNIPLVVCLSPFTNFKENINTLAFPFQAAVKCYRCEALSSSPQQTHASWYCPVCGRKNSSTSSYMRDYMEKQSKWLVYDLPHPQNSKEALKYSFRQTVFLFVLEVSPATKESGFVHEALVRIKETIQNVHVGEVLIFLINESLHFPMIRNDSVSIVSSSDVLETVFPPKRKFFFRLDSQKKLLYEFIDAADKIEGSVVDISLLDMMKIVRMFCYRVNVSTIFFVSQMATGDWKNYQNFALETLHTIIPFDFFILDINKSDYSAIREMTLITNGFYNIYSQTQADLFASELVHRINELRYNEIKISAKVPPTLKIVDIRGCGVRTTSSTFTLLTMSPRNSVYFYLDFAGRQISHGTTLNLQFHVFHYDCKFKMKVRVINHSIKVYEGFEMTNNAANLYILLSGCVNQAIDTARETNNCVNSVKEMKKLNDIFHANKYASSYFRNQKTFELMMFENALKSSNILTKPDLWPLLLGKNPNDIVLFMAPVAYQIFLGEMSVIGPLHLSEIDFNKGSFYIKLANRQGVICLSLRENLQDWINAISIPPLSDAITQICTETRIEILHPSFSQMNIFYQRLIALMA
ncbi:hypothetical protein TRFO_19761 [Tritrichomonas foetus]|uniref:Uncharacterized protein n=1 Tax=Tritrichomonas foetus TaxID=1144522 RepID=A0A1J4KHM2_9EUKA|nr:hypothetical protein TRFO_19761 [Tritrichomonas foetus]|eukprot:OHT10865.1 hypothetical protein TRFO_19761 [Tritrichomonas foetus]